MNLWLEDDNGEKVKVEKIHIEEDFIQCCFNIYCNGVKVTSISRLDLITIHPFDMSWEEIVNRHCYPSVTVSKDTVDLVPKYPEHVELIIPTIWNPDCHNDMKIFDQETVAKIAKDILNRQCKTSQMNEIPNWSIAQNILSTKGVLVCLASGPSEEIFNSAFEITVDKAKMDSEAEKEGGFIIVQHDIHKSFWGKIKDNGKMMYEIGKNISVETYQCPGANVLEKHRKTLTDFQETDIICGGIVLASYEFIGGRWIRM